MKSFEDHAKELLALAWARFDTPLWSARFDMESYLRENFVLKAEPATYDRCDPRDVPQVCTREHRCGQHGPCNGTPRTADQSFGKDDQYDGYPH